MQQIIVDIIAAGAFLFIARSFYNAFAVKRRAKAEASCPGCGTCEAAKKSAGAPAAVITAIQPK